MGRRIGVCRNVGAAREREAGEGRCGGTFVGKYLSFRKIANRPLHVLLLNTPSPLWAAELFLGFRRFFLQKRHGDARGPLDRRRMVWIIVLFITVVYCSCTVRERGGSEKRLVFDIVSNYFLRYIKSVAHFIIR